MFKILIDNLSKYNSGLSGGQWINLPQDEEKLKQTIQTILGNNEEYIILDDDLPVNIGEYADIEKLNTMLKQIQELNLDQESLTALCKSHSSLDWEEVFKTILNEDYILVEVTRETYQDEGDIARILYEDECFTVEYVGEIPEKLYDFIDWDSIWREFNISHGWNTCFFEKSGRQFAVKI